MENSLYELFNQVCDKNPESLAYKFKSGGEWREKSWRETREDCRTISKALLALGLERGDKVNILSQTRLEWVFTDFAIVNAGGVTVGIYPSNLAEDCAYIINHSDAKTIILENQEQLDKVITARKQLDKIEHIIMIDGEPKGLDGVLTWREFLAKADEVSDDDFYKRADGIKPKDIAAIVYTSGTTGVPKGVLLSHENLLFTSWSAGTSLPLKDDYITLLFLPLAHVFARLIVHFCMRNGCALAFAEGMDKIPENLKEIRPHFIASVPRIFEKVYEKITTGAEDAGGLKLGIFKWATSTGAKVSALLQENKPVPPMLKAKYKLADKLVFSKIQAALGGRIVFAISGAAPLNVNVAKFFHGCGVLILEGIGMTENTSFTNVNRFDANKFGTVGLPGPKIEQKIAEDGEVLFRGQNVMIGYYKNPEATEETIDNDGWLHTGDIGEIDNQEFLKITDRKKDLIITAGGKNIAPQRVEKIMSSSRYINQVVVFGNNKKFLTAIVTLDKDQVESWATSNSVQFTSWNDLIKSEHVKELIDNEIATRNKELASFETIKKIIIVPDEFSIESGELTPSLKIKRNIVLEKYNTELEALY